MLLRFTAGYRLIGVDKPAIFKRRILPLLACLVFALSGFVLWERFFLWPLPEHPESTPVPKPSSEPLVESLPVSEPHSEPSESLPVPAPSPVIHHAPPPHELPPLYAAHHGSESQLPQHDWFKAHPGDDDRFFFVAGHTRGLGWGNALQEHLVNAYLAYVAGRTYVFDNYTWTDDGSLYSDYNGHKIPSQIPHTALIQGPTVGGPFPHGDHAPRAVSKEYFDHICPIKHDVLRQDVHANISNIMSAALVTETWVDVLKSLDEPCVQSARESGPIYIHYEIFGVPGALLDIWPSLASSPIITHFGWSPLVELAFDVNRDLFLPPSAYPPPPPPYLTNTPFTTNADRYAAIPGLMAIHVRRGDYEQHCVQLARNTDDFVGVCAFPGMPDPFAALDKPRGEEPTPEQVEHWRKRCYPSIDEIVEKVIGIRHSPAGRDTRRLYIMTNGWPEFIADLRDALWDAAEWDVISSSRDLVLNWEQKFVAQAVDMLVAQRAQTFIGNGFSTLTSSAVMMRVANGFPIDSSRFW